MVVTRLTAFLCAGLLATPLWADTTSTKIVAAFETWMTERNIPSGQIAVARQGRVLAERGFGRHGPEDLASLSKAITAACVADLVDRGMASWDDPVNAFLPDVAAPLAQVTLAELVTHRSGVVPDSTQGRMPNWRGRGKPVYDQVIARIETRPLGPKTYNYTNDNYAVLGQILTQVAKQPYDRQCGTQVLAPMGVTTARLSPEFGRFAAWGGWRMSLGDYARFVWSQYGSSTPEDDPYADIGGGASYGLGMVWRPFGEGGHNFWHFGALCFFDGPNFMTFSVLFENGWSAVTYVEGCPENDWFGSLDQAIVSAVFQ